MEEQMEEQITLDLISTFSDVYNSDPQNKMIEDKITKNGLEESLINKTIIKENKPVFNIELPDSKRYDQKDNFPFISLSKYFFLTSDTDIFLSKIIELT